jgi:hypothetical protein
VPAITLVTAGTRRSDSKAFLEGRYLSQPYGSTEKLTTSLVFSSPSYLDDLQSSGLSGDQADVPGVEIESPGQKIEQSLVCLAVDGGGFQSNFNCASEHTIDRIHSGSGYCFDGQAAGIHVEACSRESIGDLPDSAIEEGTPWSSRPPGWCVHLFKLRTVV